MIQACKSDHYSDIVQYLMDKNADINSLNNENETGLIMGIFVTVI